MLKSDLAQSSVANQTALSRGALLAVLLAVLAHWPLILNDGVYWDGWIVHRLARDGALTPLVAMFAEQRSDAFSYLHFLLGNIGDGVLVYKLIAFGCLVLSAALTFRIAVTCGLTRAESVFLAGFAAAFTAFQAQVELIILPYLLGLTAFLGGTAIALDDAVGRRTGPLRLLLMAALFLVSFQISSLVGFYGGALLLWAALAWRNPSSLRVRAPVAALLVALPIFAIAKYVLFPPYGLYADYNRLQGDGQVLVAAVGTFIENSLWSQAKLQAGIAVAHVPAMIVLMGLLYLAARFAWKRSPGAMGEADKSRAPGAFAIAGFALILAALAILPYAAVDKPPSASGWDTRHALLIGLPVALALIAAGRLVPPRLRLAPGLLVLSACVLATWSVYLDWQIDWIKNRVLMQELATDLRPLLDVNDHLVIGEPPGWPSLNFYEYQGMVVEATGRQEWFAVNALQPSTAAEIFGVLPKERYLARDYDGRGCMLALDIGFDVTPAAYLSTAARYTYLRILRQKAVPRFLKSLGEVRARSLSEQRIADLSAIRDGLERYRAANGSYPDGAGGRTAMTVPEAQRNDWIGGLSPRFMPVTPQEPRWVGIPNRQYLYLSDKSDYKIIAHASEDAACVTALHPELKDPRRPDYAFGFWTPGAADW